MPTDVEILEAENRRKEEEHAEQIRILENKPENWTPGATMASGYAAEAERRAAEKRAAAEKAGEQS